MGQDRNRALAFLKHVYPVSEGWCFSSEKSECETGLNYVFEKDGDDTVIAMLFMTPFVKQSDVELAMSVKFKHQSRKQDYLTQMILVYGELLLEPGPLPPNVSILSLADDDEMESDDCQNLELAILN